MSGDAAGGGGGGGAACAQRVLDSGAFGEVMYAEYGDKPVAVKMLKAAVMELDAASLEDFRQEVRFMRSCRHPNIVFFYGAGMHNGAPFLVTEFLSRGSLFRILSDASVQLDVHTKVCGGAGCGAAGCWRMRMRVGG